ncbi:hypothetical protein EXIGLDRAFT_832454 [Exidia glandulosa HHB12029]|uniref:Transferase-domain-containing protein n=1 Tax=Exidia glandulosa HHB12029 TaxID=1314781 RepID=A0A165LLA2_EXIGL|nr:hypothetical protein EXIGLDRAFT_832454 [Exidia glandulosa HHB12029]
MPDAQIVPCAAADLGSRLLVLTIGFVFPTPCKDVDGLREALYKAVKEKIPKAGARLVKRAKTFEFHIPRKFSHDVPPVAFTSSVSSSPLPTTLPPKAKDGYSKDPMFLPDEPVANLFRGPTCPKVFEDFLKPNTSVTHVHVAVYADATLIGFTTTHVAFDAHGAKLLLAAWAAATRGELDTITPSPADFVPLGLESTRQRVPKDVVLPKKQPRRGWYALNKPQTMRFISRFVMRIARDPKLTHVLIRVPKAWLEEQKVEANAVLKERGQGDWVSTNDVLSAWMFQNVYLHRRDPTPVSFQSPINLRALLPDVFTVPFINNAVGMVPTPPIPARTLATQPLVDTALAIRLSLNEFRKDIPTLHAELAEDAAHPARMLFPARPGGEWAILSSWLSVKLHELDFGFGDEGAGTVRPRWVMSYVQDKSPITMRGSGSIVSEDEEAIWARWTSGSKDQKRAERARRRL